MINQLLQRILSVFLVMHSPDTPMGAHGKTAHLKSHLLLWKVNFPRVYWPNWF